MEHIFLVDPNRKLPEKTVCLKRLPSLTGWDVSTGLFRSIHIFLGFAFSSRPFTIYFRSFLILHAVAVPGEGGKCPPPNYFLPPIFAHLPVLIISVEIISR